MTGILYVRDERGDFVPASGHAVIAAAKHHMSRRVRRGATLWNPQVVRDLLSTSLASRECEYFCISHDYTELCRGRIDGAAVHPREVVKLGARQGSCERDPRPQSPFWSSRASPITSSRGACRTRSPADIRVTDHVIVA